MARPRPQLARPCVPRAAAWLTLWLFALAQLGSFVHELGTRHVRCLEHGELVDVAAPSAGAAVALGAVSASASLHVAGAGDRADHEHCSITSCSRKQRFELGVQLPRLAPPRAARVASAPVVRLAHVGQLLYRTAPKTSPPV